MGGFTPLPWDRATTPSLAATALYWEWMVRKGREHGRKFPSDYFEIHYEDLLTKPQETLRPLGNFIGHDLDYDRIRNAGMGMLSGTNSSFREEGSKQQINPLGRWKERLSPRDVAAIEGAVGKCLEETGYVLSLPPAERGLSIRGAWMRAVYPNFLSAKLWLKLNTPVGRLSDTTALELEDEPEAVAQSVRP